MVEREGKGNADGQAKVEITPGLVKRRQPLMVDGEKGTLKSRREDRKGGKERERERADKRERVVSVVSKAGPTQPILGITAYYERRQPFSRQSRAPRPRPRVRNGKSQEKTLFPYFSLAHVRCLARVH